VGLPAGWQSSDTSSPLGAWFGGDPSASGPDQVVVGADATVDEIDLEPGGFAMVTAWGPIEPTPGIEVTAVAQPDGSLRGTIHNATGTTLSDIMIVVGVRSWGGGKLEPDEDADWQIAAGGGIEDPQSGFVETPWGSAAGWGTDDGLPDPLSAVNYSVWADWRFRAADAYPTGLITAAGWTDEWVPPVDSGRTISGGRTVFTTQAAVGVAESGMLPGDAVRREFLRGSAATDVPADQDDVNMFGDAESAVVRFTLPPGTPPGKPLQIDVPSGVRSLEVLIGERWVREEAVAGGADRDPWNGGPVPVPVPGAAVDGDEVYLRISYIVGAPMWAFTLREART
jgi:hypothetical protein